MISVIPESPGPITLVSNWPGTKDRVVTFDVVKGRSEGNLKEYLQQLPGKERVKVICVDLSSTYRSIVKKHPEIIMLK